MKRLFTSILLLLVFFSSKAQRYTIYKTFNVGYSTSDIAQNTSFGFGEFLQINGALPVRILAGAEFGINSFNKGTYDSYSESYPEFTLSKKFRESYVSFPVGLEVFYKSVSVGASQEILSFNFGRLKDSTYLSPAVNGFAGRRAGLLFFNKSSLATQFYACLTIARNLSFKVGYRRQNSYFNLFDEEKKKDGIMGFSNNMMPFVQIRFNFEK